MGGAGRRETGRPSRSGSVARSFDEATKHSFQSVRRRGYSLDWDNKPNPFKVIPGSDRVELPPGVPPTGVPVLEAVRGGTAAQGERSLGLLDLARLLVVGAGVRRRVHTDEQESYFRTYASAGA